MPTAAPAPSVVLSTAAARVAERNWRGNVDALSIHQPKQAAALAGCDVGAAWTLARDGSLSARDADGRWFAGCSVPLLAGRALLKSLVVEPGGQCLLAPAHAGLVVAARERVGPDPVLFVIQPDPAVARVTLSCGDFTADLTSGRLWFAAGESWAAEFKRMFQDHPGLAAPARFIQTRLTPAQMVEPLIAEVQEVIGAVAASRAAELERQRAGRRPVVAGRTVIIAGSRFRLWSPGAELLRDAVSTTAGDRPVEYDTDNPLTASVPELFRATDGAAAIVSANLVRAGAAPVVGPETKWITWLTSPTIPTAEGAGPNDHLVLADPAWRDAAVRGGWAANQVHVGACPPQTPPPAPVAPRLGLIADTVVLEVPHAIRGYSSQRILWEAIAEELHSDPFAVGDGAEYLADRAGRMGINPAELNAELFINGLIAPAYLQGVARRLIAAQLPLRVWGQGWQDVAEFSAHAAGAVLDAGALRSAIASSTALVRPTIGTDWHPVESGGRPILSTAGHDASGWVSQAKTLLRAGHAAARRRDLPTLGKTLARLLER